ncbi:MAG: hypothetical protein KY444_01690 [Gemmatimonadetes bacterium]|nr:hypothetical protein [Gemmatimonadota bacterium]
MHYDERSRRRTILGGFALGAMLGVGAALLLSPGRVSGGDAVARARGMRAPAERRLGTRKGAAARMAKRRFSL